jgi:hypothetical protein
MLSVRRGVHKTLPLTEMKKLWDTVMLFIHRCEEWTEKPSYDLRHALLAQAKEFLNHIHRGLATSLNAGT